MQSGVPMVSRRIKLKRNTKNETAQEVTANRSGLEKKVELSIVYITVRRLLKSLRWIIF